VVVTRLAVSLVLSLYVPMCTPALQPTMPPSGAHLSELWEDPHDIASRDLFNGPWGSQHAPDPYAVYTFLRPKTGGTNPGVVVRDPLGREWHVKQPPRRSAQGEEGPVEVVLSRVLSGLGYHQPPVYFLRSFTMANASETRIEQGGRFRLHESWLKDRGSWSWQQNPFVHERPFNGLLVLLMMFNSTDLKNSNNTLYDVARDQQIQQRYVVRDLGAALGKTSRFWPRRNNLERFERTLFIRGVRDGFVEFDYHGFHRELIRRRITPADVGWAVALAERLSPRQWEDAFRAGGYQPEVAARFLDVLHARIAKARQIAAAGTQEVRGQ
jgi:hypothetical protein